VNRRARQNKRSGNGRDLVSAARVAHTRVWNTLASPTPMGNTLSLDQMQHHFVQNIEYGLVLTSSAGGATFFAKSFVFSDLPQVTSFTALFDQYKIDSIEVWITPTSTTNLNQTVVLYDAVVDYDDDTTPTTINQLLNYTNCVQQTATSGVYFRFVPHVAVAAFGGGVFTSFKNERASWIDSGSPAVRHYGIKMACTSAVNTVVFELRGRMHFSTRNVF